MNIKVATIILNIPIIFLVSKTLDIDINIYYHIITPDIVSWTLPDESRTKCIQIGGTLRDGLKGYGQYCLITGVLLDFDDALVKCADLGGSLPKINSLDEALAYHKVDCSRLNPNAESCSNARSVSYTFSFLFYSIIII